MTGIGGHHSARARSEDWISRLTSLQRLAGLLLNSAVRMAKVIGNRVLENTVAA